MHNNSIKLKTYNILQTKLNKEKKNYVIKNNLTLISLSIPLNTKLSPPHTSHQTLVLSLSLSLSLSFSLSLSLGFDHRQQ
ncbi:hypothetical protein L1987_34683 [Smallanthus sonchifolius]|uniref:Uncharacterized protein n=1 Tax=Smallanthus sonchifolius TaxID=185202 RepID=A0ACB9HV91_9ASTR|nr:hypothetical protein L1987_34683 [Smallanthus sonchifolius]